MTRRETEETALRQSARDYGCAAGDFLQKSPKVVCAPVPEGARRYLEGTAFAMASYGHCVVARTEANVCGARRFCRNANRGIALSFPPSAR